MKCDKITFSYVNTNKKINTIPQGVCPNAVDKMQLVKVRNVQLVIWAFGVVVEEGEVGVACLKVKK